MKDFPEIRLKAVHDRQVRADGAFVLYRMLGFRRLQWNFALQRAADWARELAKPLVLYEEIPLEAPWVSRRSLEFILDGVRDHLAACEDLPLTYYPYLETRPGEADALRDTLARSACVLIEDDCPVDNTRRRTDDSRQQPDCPIERVDSNGLLPLTASDQAYTTAYSFRRFLHKELPGHLLQLPEDDPLQALAKPKQSSVPAKVLKRWPALTRDDLEDLPTLLEDLPINHRVTATSRTGGSVAAREQWQLFLDERLERYPDHRNQPELRGSSELSAYLRHGQIGVHQLFHELIEREDWSLQRLGPKPTGKRSGWWGLSAAAEAFLDELVTWRELGYNMAAHCSDYREYDTLPEWAKTTLAEHAEDARPTCYSLEQFDRAETHDPLWNAAQNQLRTEGTIHNYLRMLWGKKILEWSVSPREAAEVMIELNNRYALDGCDPNSYSGIYWCLGRYDRAWGPERPIFGKIRYMSSENTARKYAVDAYLDRYGGDR